MQWDVRGAWKADGADAQMTVEAETQRAAEHLAATRGMVVESCWPLQIAAAVPPPQVPTVNVQVGMPSMVGADDPDYAFGLSYHGAFWVILIGLLFAPVGIGIVLIIWAVCARSKMNRVRATQKKLHAFPALPRKLSSTTQAPPTRKDYSR